MSAQIVSKHWQGTGIARLGGGRAVPAHMACGVGHALSKTALARRKSHAHVCVCACVGAYVASKRQDLHKSPQLATARSRPPAAQGVAWGRTGAAQPHKAEGGPGHRVAAPPCPPEEQAPKSAAYGTHRYTASAKLTEAQKKMVSQRHSHGSCVLWVEVPWQS